jgi:putative ABC transport system ATP-binding protein
LIRLHDVEKTYRRRGEVVRALAVVTLVIARGEQVALIGPSGCGKTTLLHVISGLLTPEHGVVEVAGTEIFALSEAARDRFRAEHIGYVHQTFNLLPAFTALENVELAAFFAGGSHRRAEARELLQRVGMGDRLDHRPSELSVGQQQRVAVARALINRPSLILADEPLGNQDPETGRQTLQIMLSLAEEIEATVLMVTHSPQSAAQMQRTIALPDLVPQGVAAR